MRRFDNKRAGFTLIELMVVMALIAFLAALVMLIAPGVLNKDRARDAASQLQGALQNARMRAMRDGLPRGVRLIVDPANVQPNPTTNTSPFFVQSASYQYLEVPPWLIFTNPTVTGGNVPYLQISDTISPSQQTINGTVYPAGSITTRTCTIGNLTQNQYNLLSQIVAASVSTPYAAPSLGLPTINFWTTIVPGSFTAGTQGPTVWSCSIVLFVYPDGPLGAASNWMTYQFGIYSVPRPLLGEAVVQLPLNTSVDLSNGCSQPSFSAVNGIVGVNDYDILFAPSGQLMSPTGVGQIFLWIRDPNKGTGPTTFTYQGYSAYSMSPLWTATGGWTNQAVLDQGGEQLLVSIKANSGGTGVSPVFWPTPTNQNPYTYALQASNSP
jgi:prepilin-type N-terminal cleavage/methylation domain-containing protein